MIRSRPTCSNLLRSFLLLTSAAIVNCNDQGPSRSTPTRLAFVAPPTDGEPNLAMTPAIRVAIQDEFGNVVPTANHQVTVGWGTNPTGATLSGTLIVEPKDGVATFDSVVIDEIGDGYTLHATATGLATATSAPFDIFLHFVSISAGGSVDADVIGQATHTCGLTAAGAAYCWGNGTSGQLGNGANASRNMPVLVSGGHKFVSIAAGLSHTCGVTTDRAALCWGDNTTRQLGNESTNPSNVPVLVSGANSFTSITAGSDQTCALRSDSAAMCWGDDNVGQLGNDPPFAFSAKPVLVAGNYMFASLDAGRALTCGIRTDGSAFCWGWDGYGQLGDAAGYVSSGVPVLVSGGYTFISVSGGGYHTCGVTATDGQALCWGHNFNGPVGTGSFGGDPPAPVFVAGGLTFVSVSVGARHSCGITTTGAAACWGMNNYSQLGIGTSGDQAAPVLVTGGLKFGTVSAGESHTCALSATGAYCWGRNDLGQLGNGTNATYAIPTLVAGSR
jgi:alpha-tubulin suppressor-like RCC1 family protein